MPGLITLTCGTPPSAPSAERMTLHTFMVSVPAYGKFEATFSVTTSATRLQWPYDAAPPTGVETATGITVSATFTDPNAATWQQPAFWARDFQVETRDSRTWRLPLSTGRWYVRFTPHLVGAWSVRFTILDASGTTTTSAYAFTVTTSMTRGFTRVATDPRYFTRTTGELFLAHGVNYGGIEPWTTYATGYADYSTLSNAGVSLARVWVNSLYPSAWSEWIGGRNLYDGYVPRLGSKAYNGVLCLCLASASAYSYAAGGSGGWFDAVFGQGWDTPEAIEPSTNYHIEVQYAGVGITGPRTGGSSYGLVVKTDTTFLSDAYQATSGTVVTTYGGTTSGWSTISGTWNSGSLNFLPRLHLALSNVTAGTAYVRSISVREDYGDGTYGPEILQTSSFTWHDYLSEEKALKLDDLVTHAEAQGVALQLVLLEKGDECWQQMEDAGTYTSGDGGNTDAIYGTGRTVNWVRWYQQMFWRYCQARWGYSPAIHAWELLNEGDPNDSAHYILADECAKYLKYTVFGLAAGGATHPNRHLCSTSFWSGAPSAAFWANATYPYCDYADLHAYLSTSFAPTSDRQLMEVDAAYSHLYHSDAVRDLATGKPWVRGETGIDSYSDTDQNVGALLPTVADGQTRRRISEDTANWWLHNFLWSCVDSGGMGELYWWAEEVTYPHIRTTGWPTFRIVRDFLMQFALHSGGYVDWRGTCSNANLRVEGQKTATSCHLWIQNRAHTWRNILNGVSITGQSGTITLTGMTNGTYTASWVNTQTGAVSSTQSVTASGGTLTLSVSSLTTDIAVWVA